MFLRNVPIQKKLMTVIMLISGVVLLLTCVAFFAYEFITFRQSTVRQLSTLGEIISANSTAALAFDSPEDAAEILNALSAEKHIIGACLYNEEGKLFSQYPATLNANQFPVKPGEVGYHFLNSHLEGYQTVALGDRKLGTLYLKSDLGAMYERFKLYAVIMTLVVLLATVLAYLLSRMMQKEISMPIIALANTAEAISNHKDYSVRAVKTGNDELGLLTDAFNEMLTQIQKQNQSLSEFNQKLEQKVSERTLELEAANKELESFSYSISHDLRAPLRSIKGYASIFMENNEAKLDQESKVVIDNILHNTNKMQQLIEDLLAFSKLGRQELRKATVSMKDMVKNISDELRKAEGDRRISISISELPAAHADESTIKQVWVNLISNALKYTRHKEEAFIEIGFTEQNDEVIYFVKDNGAGFDMKYYDKLFGVFQRLHSQLEFEGIGVGLAIVHRVIERHKGKIWAEAVPEQGATFYFTLGK